MKEQSLRIAVVGDVHDQWEAADQQALLHLGVDLVLFVGDFGNESVKIVQQVSSLPLNKAIILGNHDAWYTASEWGRKNRPYEPSVDNWFTQQLDLLGYNHVGYSKLDFPELEVSVVGSRPFSWGGSYWKNKEFLEELYQVHNFEESRNKIISAARETDYNNLIFLAHNGPHGLGNKAHSICGRDWEPRGGDFGDLDLTEAIQAVRNAGKLVHLVVFGHMHHRLRYTQNYSREKIIRDAAGTIYLNAASVPRIIHTKNSLLRNFTLVTYRNQQITEVSLVWLDQNFNRAKEEILLAKATILG